MAEQTITLNPAESKLISFEAVPHEAKTYQVQVDGISGSFAAIRREPSAYLIQLQKSLADLRYNLETWGESEENWFYVPGVGICTMTWDTYNLIKSLMIQEAINIKLISSSSDCYFANSHLYYIDGTLIV